MLPRLSNPRLSGPPLSGPRLSGPPLSGPRLSGPPLSGPRLSGRFSWDFREKKSFFFSAPRANLVFNIHIGPCYAFLCVVKVPKINILMCKTLRAWKKKGRKIVPRRSKRLMRDFKVPRIHLKGAKWDTFIIQSFSIIRSYSLNPVSNTTG